MVVWGADHWLPRRCVPACYRTDDLLQALMLLLAVLVITAPDLRAHDGTSYGRAYRSRDMGATWLGADTGLFLRSAIAIVDPQEFLARSARHRHRPARTRNGGRQWARDRREHGWADHRRGLRCGRALGRRRGPMGSIAGTAHAESRSGVPGGATPSRVITAGAGPAQFYLLGRTRLFVSNDDGASFHRVSDALCRVLRASPG